MSNLIQALDARRFPLHGLRLIEASAGTGKTFTIAALYLRLVLGARSEDDGLAFNAGGLLPPQILVVTFTEAATEELRERIRSRLVEAARAFRQNDSDDAFLHELLDDYPAGQRGRHAHQLELAAQWMDEAAIFTIHAYCQKMLRTHAFDSGSLFELTVNTDESALREQAVNDYWRRYFYPLPRARLLPLQAIAASPAELGRLALPLLGRLPAGPADWTPVEAILAARRAEKAAWRQQGWLEELARTLTGLRENKTVNGNTVRADSCQKWLDDLADWLARDSDDLPLAGKPFDTARWRLTPAGILDALKAGMSFDPPEPFFAVERLLQPALADTSLRAALLTHATRSIAAALAAEKSRRAEIGFDDMIRGLAQALAPDSPNRERLAQALRQAYPVALIDEFQDTDPAQYAIFRTLYADAGPEARLGLLMIGDPKQAIYAFRGADIFTYLAARHDTRPEQRYTLDTNWRSTTAMVGVVNRLFCGSPEAGTVSETVFGRPDIPFQAVRAAGRSEQLVQGGMPVPPLTLAWRQEAGNKDDYRQEFARRAAEAITTLLNDSGAGLLAGDGGFEPLLPRDMAVLVRDWQEAAAIRRALDLCGVRSVYLSDKDSVFASQEAQDLVRWLDAVLYAEDNARLRLALATATLGLDYAGLDRLFNDEREWERTSERFRSYRQTWRQQGVLPMLLALLHDYRLPARLLARRDEGGERQLTNLLHLAERLQADAAGIDGEVGVLRHLERLTEQPDAAQESVLRLESEDARVRVVTLHKSKGLEYPLVFLPFLAGGRAQPDGRNGIFWHDGDGRLQVDLTGQDADGLAAMQRESAQEDMRLLYVALTRARHALWIGLSPLSGTGDLLAGSAIGRLLQLDSDPGRLAGRLEALAQAGSGIRLDDTPPADPPPRYCDSTPAPVLFPARRLTRRIARRWRIASYSALLTGPAQAGTLAAEDSAAANRIDDTATPDSPVLPIAGRTLAGFWRGPQAGIFLHGLLEWAAQQGFGRTCELAAERRDLLARRCQRRELAGWIDFFDGWLPWVLTRPLPLNDASPVTLAALPPRSARAETEFWLGNPQLATTALDAAVSATVWPGHARPALLPQSLQGLFKGFIDLMFEHEGRFYVLDYKSNWLGDTPGSYHSDALRDEMLAHRYELQGMLYLLALHRLLRARLGADYDPATRLGGFVCWFLRGTDGPGAGIVHLPADPALLDRLDHLFACETPDADA